MTHADWFKSYETDVLVIGGGLAALRAAISAHRAGARVLVAGKRRIGRSGSSANTTGGYAAALPRINAHDSARLHFIDTVMGGGFVNDRKLVRALVEDAPARLFELRDFGAQFRRRDGHYHLSPSGDHTQARVLVPENMRGTDMTIPMREAAERIGIGFLEDCAILDLLRAEDRVVGAVGIGRTRPEGHVIRAGATILAAGGAGRMFTITSNPVDVCGGGYALALRAGAMLRDMEFIQFYPWRLIRPFKSTRVPIQPSTFVIGGRLYNSRGERFMESYDPVKKEAAMRDVSARAIADQIRLGLSVEGGVVLDVSQIPDDQFRYENPKIVELLEPKRIDYRSIRLVVAPEAHFFMGGVAIDECGRSTLPGLYAAGENAGGIHGGNRLNSNAIPDTQVFGHRAGCAAASAAQAKPAKTPDPAPIDSAARQLKRVNSAEGASAECAMLLQHLQQAMSVGLGIVRTAEGLAQAIADVDAIRSRLSALPIRSHGDLIAAVEIEDLCLTALACASSATARTESRAAHFRTDHPHTGPDWVRTVHYGRNGVEISPIEVDPDEATWAAARDAAQTDSSHGEKEYVE